MASPQTLQERALDQACQTMVFVALELSDKKWKLACSDGNKRCIVTIAAGVSSPWVRSWPRPKRALGGPGAYPS